MNPKPARLQRGQKIRARISALSALSAVINLRRMAKISRIALFILIAISAQRVSAQTLPDTWIDRSPHKESFFQSNGITLEYLDWGGAGEPLIFLAGLGSTAHIFDNIAPKFTDHFHVLALTRRGFGKSDKPTVGYDGMTLVQDVHAFFDALKIDHAILAGHSFAEVELTGFAELFPTRVDKLIYFDNAYAYDQPGTIELLGQIESITPQRTSADSANFPTLLHWFQTHRPGWNDACEADLRATCIVTNGQITAHSSTPAAAWESLGVVYFSTPRDFASIKCPIQAFFADHQLQRFVPPSSDPSHARVQQIVDHATDWWHTQIKSFKQKVPTAKVVEMPDTDHFCFIQRQDEVVRDMKSFLLGN
jgi:non-heme chloroperoxidase